MKASSPKAAPLENSDQSGESKHPELMHQLKSVQEKYEKAKANGKEKFKAELQRLSNEKKRLTGDANPPAD